MRQGRPSMGQYFRGQIVTALGGLQGLQYPVTATTLMHSLETRRGRGCSWHTVLKYLGQLSEQGVVSRQVLPTQPGRKPLVVYFLRQC